jgi:hypothetical protein
LRLCADPSIFYGTQAQSEGGFKSIAELYNEAGLSNLSEGENAEIAGMERILEHWRDLDHREPTLKIVCPHDYSRKRFGLFHDGCSNLLWELMRTRRAQLSATQLMRKNPTEAIVDKDNHLRDALKYILLSLPSPSEKPARLQTGRDNCRGDSQWKATNARNAYGSIRREAKSQMRSCLLPDAMATKDLNVAAGFRGTRP